MSLTLPHSPQPHAFGSAAEVTADGATWLTSAETYPRRVLTDWRARPHEPAVLSCGSAFDVVSVPAVFGRRMVDRLWHEGPGSGPVAVHRGRVLLFAAPGTAQRLPSLLRWEEWGSAVPSLLCHGAGDAVTVPPLARDERDRGGSRWVVAPDTRSPWLPGPEVVLWACLRAARGATEAAVRISIFPSGDQSAKVYDVSRRR
ncbi:bifunctional DNA primase/polymerase [Streptomyces sp. AN091965]|uniref:bifunctional DNA primase/polymerase n=1 Tax=Streptomyces sp. AN091965 TaxID=2927803 RepID=UPI001F60CC24|nr:bifunctional DNA primase/polymerase [Streptomyces sp. AN091965]MCI3930863.1 bifunctional DNA primase/polymerase [Streptomyces sp. AN091965]